MLLVFLRLVFPRAAQQFLDFALSLSLPLSDPRRLHTDFQNVRAWGPPSGVRIRDDSLSVRGGWMRFDGEEESNRDT